LIPINELSDGVSVLGATRVLEVEDEAFEGSDHLLHRDVGAVDDSHLVACLRVGVLHVLRCVRAGVVGALVNAVRHIQIGARLEGSAPRSVPCII
jgi:hypothetical protein